MRKTCTLVLALALGASAAALAAPAQPGNPDLQNMVAMYQGQSVVRVVERFDDGGVATVDLLPGYNYRVAETGTKEDPGLVLHIATQPIDGARWPGTYEVKSLGHKTIEGTPVNGYQITAPDNSYAETVWVIQGRNLPLQAHIVTDGHTIDVQYGNYGDQNLVATP
jgi:hypothetical protein